MTGWVRDLLLYRMLTTYLTSHDFLFHTIQCIVFHSASDILALINFLKILLQMGPTTLEQFRQKIKHFVCYNLILSHKLCYLQTNVLGGEEVLCS